jgi:hypothetical protein
MNKYLDSGVAAVGKWARRAIAHARHVVFIAAEVLCCCLGLEATVVVIDHLPDDLIILHGCSPTPPRRREPAGASEGGLALLGVLCRCRSLLHAARSTQSMSLMPLKRAEWVLIAIMLVL